MTHRMKMLPFLAAVLVLPIATALAAGQTAKSPLPQVGAAGKKWQSDAALVSLSSTSVQQDGTATEWKYSFYSPGTKKRCVITASGSNVRLKEVNLGFSTEPLGEFIDSDKAMQIAKDNGLKGKEPNMAVKFQGTGRSAAAYWIVNGGLSKGNASVFLDAKTGTFVSRSVME